MITLRKYQEEAVERLLRDTYSLLKKPGAQHKMVLKAPTGAGKTVTMAAFLNQLCNELPDRLDVPKRQVAFIWFAPNQLHLQSYLSLKDYFEELRTIKPIQFEDITDGKLQPNEMLFVNWQSVNKANNLYIKENEQGKDLLKFVYNAMLNDIEININPLLLIQLPNETQKESALDNQIIEEVQTYLMSRDITVQNNRLAVWLSNEKSNLDGIEEPNCMTDVLLFKQAIALGWDCPRAAVLLIFREIKQEHFGIQTVGRILRMPEQKHYPNPMLNNGYVYTNLSKDMIYIVQEDIDYIVQNRATRIDEYQEIALDSSFINTGLIRNRLSSGFRKCLYQAAEEYFDLTRDATETGGLTIEEYNKNQLASKFIELDVDKIEIPIPKDVQIAIEVGATRVDDKEKFAKTTNELNVLFRQFCRDHVGGYAKADSTSVLELGLKMLFEDYLIMDEFRAIKIILFEIHKPKFIELIDQALVKHEALLQQKAAQMSKRVEHTKWEVPKERLFNEYYQQRNVDDHALEPFYEYKSASRPEKEFVGFLENHKDHLDWWYKNGDKNKEDFAVTYEDVNGVTRGFYVDFVIKLKNGSIALFDTKTLDSDPNFVRKHNALFNYIQEKSTTEKPLIGGVIVPRTNSDYTVWKYADNLIDKANDHTGWAAFDPSRLN